MAERKKLEQLSSVDTAWLRMEHPTNLMMITGVMTFDEPIEFERLKATIEHRMLRFDRFRQRVTSLGDGKEAPCWENDPHFDIRSHLRRIALPAPHNQQALEELASDLMSTPLDYSKPLWQMHLVENYGTGCAIITRLHHCIADGIALVHVMLSMTDQSPTAPWPTSLKAEEHAARKPLSSVWDSSSALFDKARRTTTSMWREGMNLVADPSKILEAMQMSATGVTSAGKLLTMPPDPQTAFKGKLGVAKRAVWSAPIPLEEVKAIGRFTRGTINDILLTAMTGGLRHYLLKRNQPVEGIDIRAVVPVNLRPLTTTPRLGNQFGLVFLALPVGIADPLDRLLELQERMDAIKSSPEALVAFGILNAMGIAPKQIQDQLVNIFGVKATGVMTNVPGPRQPLYMAGRQMKELMFWVPQSGRLGLGVSILSYNGTVQLGVATDVGLVPDPDVIIAGFHREFESFKEMVARAEAAQSQPEAGEGAAEAEAEPVRSEAVLV